MTFVNEYVSAEDIKKYDLEYMVYEYNPNHTYRGIPCRYKFDWTVDKEKDIYLIKLRNGMEEFSHESDWAFHFLGSTYIVKLAYGEGCSMTYSESPYTVFWDLLKIERYKNSLDIENKEEIIEVLKKAIVAYGDKGVNSYIDSVIVKFTF